MRSKVKVGIGIDSHRFSSNKRKPLVLGGVWIPGTRGLEGNSDADVVLHAMTDAVSTITGRNVIGEISDELAHSGVTQSSEYFKLALEDLRKLGMIIAHTSISIEAKYPRLEPYLEKMKQSIAELADVSVNDVGITVTSGEGLTAFGRGLGIKAVAIVTSIACEK